MTEEYSPPQHVIDEWKKSCSCCPECYMDIPCGGVQAGGMCDEMCQCIDEDEQCGFESECYMGADGICSAAGSEHCDWDCPDGGC